MRIAKDPIERFLAAFEVQENGCWMWQLSTNVRSGYGQFSTARASTAIAHVWAWKTFRGEIPPGWTVEHNCHTRALDLGLCGGGPMCLHRPCVNWVSHLELLPRGENARRGITGRREECPAQHLYDEENTYITPLGHRQCRKCKAANQRRYIQHLVELGLPIPR